MPETPRELLSAIARLEQRLTRLEAKLTWQMRNGSSAVARATLRELETLRLERKHLKVAYAKASYLKPRTSRLYER
jgi:hypothetical protein